MKYSHLNRLYINNEILENQNLIFTGEQYHYLKSVLRLNLTDNFRIFNGINGEFIAQIIEISKNYLVAKVNDKFRKLVLEKKLILALCIIKPDRMIEAIKGAVQLGVTKIVPIISERTQIKQFNLERFNKCIIEATQQSERMQPPIIDKIMYLEEYINDIDSGQIIFANEDEDNQTINNIKNFSDPISILIGPEGGFSPNEQKTIKNNSQTISVTLSENILRSEIATLASIACITMLRG